MCKCGFYSNRVTTVHVNAPSEFLHNQICLSSQDSCGQGNTLLISSLSTYSQVSGCSLLNQAQTLTEVITVVCWNSLFTVFIMFECSLDNQRPLPQLMVWPKCVEANDS